MDILFALALACLVLFMLLATYDGAYLHLWKYELFSHAESRFEHQTHTVRAILFPIIVFLLFVQTDAWSFQLGLGLVALDLLVLGMDALSEKESRQFMGGLPSWEYVLHIFANSLHFAAIILVAATRLESTGGVWGYSETFLSSSLLPTVQWVGMNIIPGAVVLAFLHVLLSLPLGQRFYQLQRARVTCC